MPKCQRDKFQPRVVPCVFVGYPFGQKGYKLYNLKTKSILISRDVIFHESIFPYSFSLSSPTTSTFGSSPCLIPDDFISTAPDFPFSHSSNVFPLFQQTLSTSVSLSPPPSSVHYSPPTPRKSYRHHQVPSYLQDYVVQQFLLPSPTPLLSLFLLPCLL